MIDTHCHLTAGPYDGDREDVLLRAAAAGVSEIISIASDLDDAERVSDLVRWSRDRDDLPRIHGTAGIHPHEVGKLADPPVATAPSLARLRERMAAPGIVALGECGLDFHYDFAPRELQARWFGLQLELAEALGRPVVVHCRDAEEAMTPRVREAGEAGVRGVLHCFPGDLDLLEVALDAGWSVSFTGMVTFRSFRGEPAVRAVPADRYFLETDGPYLAPVPHRGRRNEPAFVVAIAETVATIRGESLDEVTTQTTRSAHRFFGIS